MICGFCKEPVLAVEQDTAYNHPMHWECGLRLAIGSVAHQERRCSCYVPGSYADDPPGMTPREAARAAARMFYLQRERN